MIDEAAAAHVGHDWGLAGADLSEVLDPWRIVLSRQATGGAAPAALARMVAELAESTAELAATARAREEAFDRAEEQLLATAEAATTATPD
jgi:argininosuccinate lyase